MNAGADQNSLLLASDATLTPAADTMGDVPDELFIPLRARIGVTTLPEDKRRLGVPVCPDCVAGMQGDGRVVLPSVADGVWQFTEASR